jgi:hypothetical protein
MKQLSKSKEVLWIDTLYRYTYHPGSQLIEIEVKVPNGFWGSSQMVYKRIYFGHVDPIRDAVQFFDESKL